MHNITGLYILETFEPTALYPTDLYATLLMAPLILVNE